MLAAQTLADQRFFQGFNADQLARLAACGDTTTFPAGEYICREGDEANHFYLLTQGQVAVEVFVPGREPITLQTLTVGDLLGWSWFYPPYRWHFDARAATLTRALVFDAPRVKQLCDSDHDLGYELVKHFADTLFERLQATRLQLLDVYGNG